MRKWILKGTTLKTPFHIAVFELRSQLIWIRFVFHSACIWNNVSKLDNVHSLGRSVVHKNIQNYEVIKLVSCSTQLSMKFIRLINFKMSPIVDFLTFI